MRLDHIADIDLGFTNDFRTVEPYGSGEGTAFGEGLGTVSGKAFNGKIRWCNLAHRRSDGNLLSDYLGLIETNDGAYVMAKMKTRTIFSEDRVMAGQNLVISFEAEDEKYRWLNEVLCVGEGRLDVVPLEAQIRVYACINELVEPALDDELTEPLPETSS
jgi:Protein of unknown function (DUF3237)